MLQAIPQVRFSDLSLRQMVLVYNSLAPAPVTKFESVRAARKRVAKVLTEIFPGTSFMDNGAIAVLPRPVEFNHETLAFEGVEPVSETAVAEPVLYVDGRMADLDDNLTTADDQSGDQGAGSTKGDASEPATPKEQPFANPREQRGRSGRRMFTDTQVVTVLVANPKRPGSGAHERFAKYRSPMTVAEALAAGVRPDDLIWDVRHDFITIE